MITVQSYINSFFAIRRGLSSCILLRFVLHGTEFWVFFSSAEWFGTKFREFASIFVPWNWIPSCFLFRGRVQNGIPRLCFFIVSMERNSKLFSVSRKGLEWNSERFLFRGTALIPSKITICSVYSVFRGIIFLSEIPNPNPDTDLDTDPDPVPNQGFLGLAIFISNIRREHYFFQFFFFLYSIQKYFTQCHGKISTNSNSSRWHGREK